VKLSETGLPKLAARLLRERKKFSPTETVTNLPTEVAMSSDAPSPPLTDGHREGTFFIDQLIASSGGDICFIGWIDDEFADISGIDVKIDKHTFFVPSQEMVRWNRPDVAQHLGSRTRANTFGAFWIGRMETEHGFIHDGHFKARFESHKPTSSVKVNLLTEQEFLEHFLQFLSDKEQSGIEKRLFADSFLKTRSHVIDLWHRQRDAQTIKSDQTYGEPPKNPEFAAISVLYGTAEPVALQSRLLYGNVPCGKVEIIYVNNSPEISENIHREAHLFHVTTGHTVRVITLTENIGFGAANDIAVSHCISDVIALVNPDVFDASGKWYHTLASYKGNLPAPVCGAVLSYADGAIMHDGIDVISDPTIMENIEGQPSQLLTAEHFGKGAPPWALPSQGYRTVPAVSGAFICTTKEIHESIGGFDKDYVFGHYEDADYCLRAWSSGQQVCVLRELVLVHMEGKGSTSKPFHRGGRLINRCTFTQRWHKDIDSIRDLAKDTSEPAVISLVQ
jgi:GT2 family glycosyltransferase